MKANKERGAIQGRDETGRASEFGQFVIRAATAMAVLLAVAWPGLAVGDDTPQPSCVAVAHRLLDVRTSGNLERLDDTQRANVRFYLSELQRLGSPVPKRLNVLNHPLIRAAHPSNLSFILPGGRCPERCEGVAVVRGAEKTEIVKFSYGTTFALVPPEGPWRQIDQLVSERLSSAIVFMDVEEKTLLAFRDVLRVPTATPYERRANNAEAVGSEISIFVDRDRLTSPGPYGNYLACLRNIFDAEGQITKPRSD